MWLDLEESSEARLEDAAMIVAISTSLPQYRGLYSQGREVGRYLLQKLEFTKEATIHSSSLSPEVLVRPDGLSTLPECSVHLNRGRRDLLLLSGDTSPMEDQFQFTRAVLEYARKRGVAEIYSVGARWTEVPVPAESEPQSNGFATDGTGVARLKKHGVRMLSDEPAPFFASMVVGLAKDYGIRGYKLAVDHGEPNPHSRSVAALVGVLSSLAGFDISVDELRSPDGAKAPPREPGDSTIYH